ncbi:Serine/threonine-protein kinase PknB [Pirellulimonas nuda]|uniref:Serine/threonine-protein kinase PknB n=1 Tax=Pirellulimonas nuda TaxID=2528009 RepID=A0A518D6P5_9BACT|nr:protein kinase [Pirellulimonas nuda]QDU87125.1 Serine/threonine-protein kinase PknB [Pirellulimonas nuda]
MSGLRTFLFTDIVSSVDLKSQMAGSSTIERDEAYVATILTPHRERMDAGLAELGGRVVSTAGDGHFLVFGDTARAARWAIAVQRSHASQPIRAPGGQAVQVRMSLHVGVPQPDPSDPNNFIGKAVDYAARLCDYASGGQVLASRAAVAILEDAGLADVHFHRHEDRQLKGIGRVEVHELLYDRTSPRRPRQSPSDPSEKPREWTVLPPTEGLTAWGGARPPVGADSSTHLASPSKTLPMVRRVGNYQLEALLGAGGMGNVYRARHTQFGRTRAVKVIKPHLVEGGREDVVRRFYQEIRAIGALEHPNIVVAIDSSAPEDATHYLVMEYVDGLGADELLARVGPLAPADACEIVRQAALGLEYIAQQGMVHRDIKPSNLMLALAPSLLPGDPAKATVKILDLGLALLVGDDQQRLTQLDQGAMGTGLYMSPEQWRTTSVDIRADIYSLGCTLHHLLTGRPPYGDSDLRQEIAHEREPTPDLSTLPGVSRELAGVLQQMMAKQPADRFAHPADIAAALAPLAEGADLEGLIELARGGSEPSGRRVHPAGETHPRGRSATPVSTRPSTRAPLWRRLALPVGLIALLGMAGWLAVIDMGRRQQSIAQRQQTLEVAAGFAAEQLAIEIDSRIGVLTKLSRSPELREAMLAIADAPDNEALWAPVQQWIVQQKEEYDNELPSDSWFITNAAGRQVARSPEGESIGREYATRDYFHGLGTNEPVGDAALVPIEAPHQSVVYASTSSRGDLKVAFSVPIWNGERITERRKVIGVLAMSLDLGTFRVLENTKRLPPPLEAVLIDLRPDDLPSGDQRGLLLHHPQLKQFNSDEQPLRVRPELMEQIEAAGRKEGRPLGPYPDLLRRRGEPNYRAAMEPVMVRYSESDPDTRWLVLVQEPAQ